MMSDKPYMVQQVIKYSDGTETVLQYKPNPLGAGVIEEKVAAAVAGDHKVASVEEVEVVSEVTASEVVSEVGEASGSEEVEA